MICTFQGILSNVYIYLINFLSIMLSKIALIIVIIGGINWGLIGFFDFNIISTYLPAFETIAYIVVGISSLLAIRRI